MKQFNKTEIKHFHPEGKSMPNGSNFQRGGYLNDCKNNFNSFVLDDGVYAKQHSVSKCSGGIIVFPVSANLGQSLSNYDAFLSAIRLFIETHKSLFHKEGIIPFLNFRGSVRAYSIGEFFKGRYVTSNGELFNESSVCIEIDGLSSKSLFQICEMISEQFQQKTVLIKDLTKNMIYLSNS